MLNKESFKPLLGDWYQKIEPLFDNGVMEGIYSILKEQSKEGKRIAPESADTFKCFTATPLSNLKVVLCGLCPFHSEKDGVIVADGLAMSSSKTGIKQPSLVNFYEGLEKEFCEGMCLEANKPASLSYLAEQGVLLFNAALTTEIGKAGSHNLLWKPFTQYIFEHIISLTGVPVVFLGKEAAEFSRYLAPMQWHFELSHPAAASYAGIQWDTKGTFRKVNKVIHDTNGHSIWWIDDMPF